MADRDEILAAVLAAVIPQAAGDFISFVHRSVPVRADSLIAGVEDVDDKFLSHCFAFVLAGVVCFDAPLYAHRHICGNGFNQ